MKTWRRAVMAMILAFCSARVNAQVQELEQLALDIEKLAQFKQILADLKTGYEIISVGYNTIKDISEGNFNLHKAFLDGLLDVNPAIKKYRRVADIIDNQVKLVSEYRSAFNRFQLGGWLVSTEISYIRQVYDKLLNASLQNLDDLFTVITAGTLRMSDEERLEAIDEIYRSSAEKLAFLRSFNGSTSILALQRAREKRELKQMKSAY